MPLASRPKGLRQSRPPVRVAESAANTCWVSGSQARLVAQPEAKLRTWEGARFIGHAVPRLARGLSSAPMISMTQIGPRYGRRNSLRSPNLGGAMSMLKHAALLTLSSSTRPDSHIFVLVRAPEPILRSASFAPPRLLSMEFVKR